MRTSVVLVALALSACGSHERQPYVVVSPPRDWDRDPAVVEIDAPSTIYAMSDVHGGYERMVELLAAHGIVVARPAQPSDARWGAGDAVFVVAGDVMDKGPMPLESLDLLRALEPQAAAVGGRVVLTLGNHEAEFMYDPENAKATKDDGVDEEIRAHGLSPVGVANGSDVHGQWLRDRPFAVRVGAWFFAHAGDTHGRTIADLNRAIRDGITAHDYADAEAVGDDSILESRDWYSASGATAANYAAALNARHIVFGHQPDALGPRGEIAVAFDGALFRIDCGMSPNVDDSHGKLLRVHREGDLDVAESLGPDGSASEIWRGP